MFISVFTAVDLTHSQQKLSQLINRCVFISVFTAVDLTHSQQMCVYLSVHAAADQTGLELAQQH